jgi:hypothetical protein
MDVSIAIAFLGTLAWLALWGASLCIDRAYKHDVKLAEDGYPVTYPLLPGEED